MSTIKKECHRKKVHVENKKKIMYYKCVINAKRTKVGEVKIGVEIWMSPSKSLPILLQVDPVDTVPHRIFMCLPFLLTLLDDSPVVQKWPIWPDCANWFGNMKYALMKRYQAQLLQVLCSRFILAKQLLNKRRRKSLSPADRMWCKSHRCIVGVMAKSAGWRQNAWQMLMGSSKKHGIA